MEFGWKPVISSMGTNSCHMPSMCSTGLALHFSLTHVWTQITKSFHKGKAEIPGRQSQTGNDLQDFEQGNDITRVCYLEMEKKIYGDRENAHVPKRSTATCQKYDV